MSDSYQRINTACLILIAAAASTMALIYTRSILVPFVFALFIYVAVSPLLHVLEHRWGVPKWAAIGGALIVYLAISTLVIFLMVNSVSNFFESADIYRAKIFEFVQWADQFAAQWNFDLDKQAILTQLTNLPYFSVAKNISGTAFSMLGKTILIIIFVMFLLISEGKERSEHPLVLEMQTKISRYLFTKIFISAVTGIIVFIILVSFGVELALMFGFLTFLLNFIPSIGSIIATVLPLPVVLLQYNFEWQFFGVLILSGLTQFIMGNVIEPKLMGEKMDLHPVAVLLFLVFWGLVWGIAGMFIAVPITAILKIVFSRIEPTKPIAELLAGRLPQS